MPDRDTQTRNLLLIYVLDKMSLIRNIDIRGMRYHQTIFNRGGGEKK